MLFVINGSVRNSRNPRGASMRHKVTAWEKLNNQYVAFSVKSAKMK